MVWSHSVKVWWPFWAVSQALITLRVRCSTVFLGFSQYKLCFYGDMERRRPKRRSIAWIAWVESPADVDNNLQRMTRMQCSVMYPWGSRSIRGWRASTVSHFERGSGVTMGVDSSENKVHKLVIFVAPVVCSEDCSGTLGGMDFPLQLHQCKPAEIYFLYFIL